MGCLDEESLFLTSCLCSLLVYRLNVCRRLGGICLGLRLSLRGCWRGRRGGGIFCRLRGLGRRGRLTFLKGREGKGRGEERERDEFKG